MRTGLVMFEWHALGHVPLSYSYAPVPHLSSTVYDYFHLNSIQPQADGDLLIGARNTWAAYMISTANGGTVWTLGGKHSSFTLGPGVRFAWEHDAEVLPEGNVSIFDDEASPPESNQSRAIVIALEPGHAHGDARAPADPSRDAHPHPEPGQRAGAAGRRRVRRLGRSRLRLRVLRRRRARLRHAPAAGRRAAIAPTGCPWSATPAHAPSSPPAPGAGATHRGRTRAGTAPPPSPAGGCLPGARRRR